MIARISSNHSFFVEISTKSKDVITKIAQAALSALKKYCLKRKGYHFRMEKNLSPKNTIPFIPYCGIATSSYRNNPYWFRPYRYNMIDANDMEIETKTLPGNIIVKDKVFFDSSSGFKAMIVERENEIVIAFGCLGSGRSMMSGRFQQEMLVMYQYRSIIKNYLGIKPEYYNQANALISLLKQHPKFFQRKIVVTGQCLGGSIAEYVALKHKINAYCFNSVQLGAELQREVGNKNLELADRYVTHISVKNDLISDLPGVNILNITLSLLGICTPKNFGHRYSIPSNYYHPGRSHGLMLYSMLSYKQNK